MNLPVVAIVGRPNVGKSTLFNRIVGGREAIVDDQPGVTRDRKYALAEWCGRRFILVDTGGYLPGTDDKIEQAVVRQIQEAIHEADLILFLVDAKTGLTEFDKELAVVLKKSARPVVLVVNKVDNDARELNAVEFYELGFDEPLPVSAVSGRRSGDLLDRVVALLPKAPPAMENSNGHLISLAIVGRPNVGKSSLVNALVGAEKMIVTDIPGTTRDAIDTRIKYYGQEFLLIDTAGLRRQSKVKDAVEYYSSLRSHESIKRCDVAILMIDATTGMEMQDLRILGEAVRMNKGVVIAINKWDLVEKDSNTAREYEIKIRETLKSNDFLPIVFISAITKQRIYKLIETAKTIYQERQKTLKTSELNDFLAEATRRYAPPSMDQREVKIKYCTQVKTNPPVIAFFTNAPDSIKPHYRAYLEKQFRQRFGFAGVPLTFVFRKK
jgi:GTP-binding protein